MGPKGGKGPSPPSSEDDGERVDFVLTLGGDGLLMYSNTLFRVRELLFSLFYSFCPFFFQNLGLVLLCECQGD